MGEAPGLFEWPGQVEPLDCEGPCDGDHLECLGQEVSLLSVVLAPFVGAHNLLSVSYYGWPVEALSECVSDQGSRSGMVTADLPWISLSKRFPCSMGMKRCRIPVWLHL